MAFTHKILLCYSILLLLAVLARSNKSLDTSMPSFHDTHELIAAPDLDHIDAHEPLPSNDGYDQLTFPPPQYHIDNEPLPSNDGYDQLTFPPPQYHIDSEPLPSNDGYDQLTFPPPQYHIDNESPPSKLNPDAHVSPPRHNDSHDSTALPDHDDNDGHQGMLPNNDTVTGAEGAANCYGLCSKIPGPCSSFCKEKGYSGGTCVGGIGLRPPLIRSCCCSSK